MGALGGYMFYDARSNTYYMRTDNVTGAVVFQHPIQWHEYVLASSNIIISLVFITVLLWVFEKAVLQYLKIHDAVTFVSALAEAGDALSQRLPYLDFRYKENIISWSRLRLYFRTFNRRSVVALEMFMGTILVLDAFALVTFLAMIFLLKTKGLVNYTFRFNVSKVEEIPAISPSPSLPPTRPAFLPTYPPICLPTYLPTHLSTYSPIYLPAYLPTYPCTSLPTYFAPSLPLFTLTPTPDNRSSMTPMPCSTPSQRKRGGRFSTTKACGQKPRSRSSLASSS